MDARHILTGLGWMLAGALAHAELSALVAVEPTDRKAGHTIVRSAIEYGIAQLGAIGVWKNYRENPEQGLQGYLDALKLGYTAPIGKIYEAARVPFDFSKAHITDLMNFVWEELEALR